MRQFALGGKIALVTGASRGLGFEMARALASAGATVILAARDAARLVEAALRIRTEGGRVDVQAFDLTDENGIIDAVAAVLDRHGRIDILLNNAGVCIWNDFATSTLESWHQTINTNLTATYLLAREVARPMIAQRGGASSMSAPSSPPRAGKSCRPMLPASTVWRVSPSRSRRNSASTVSVAMGSARGIF